MPYDREMHNSEQDIPTWQALLGVIFKENPTLHQQLADEIHANPITIKRWLSGQEPHQGNLKALVNARILSPYRNRLLVLVRQAYPDFQPDPLGSLDENPCEIIPPEIYRRVLECRSGTFPTSVFSLISELVQEEIRKHLQVNIDTRILLLTPPWLQDQDSFLIHSFYLPARQIPAGPAKTYWMPVLTGSESVLSFVPMADSMPLIFSHDQLPAWFASSRTMQVIEEVAAVPLLCMGRVGGCFVVLSKERPFFTAARQQIIRDYGSLLSLALRENQFYERSQIALGSFPSLEDQLKKNKELPFLNRVAQLRLSHPYIPQETLELVAIRQLEKDLMTSEIIFKESDKEDHYVT